MGTPKIAATGSPLSLQVCNRQKTRRINLAYLRQLVRWLLDEWPAGAGELCIHLINATAMTGLNVEFLGHAGSTDVITFDYRENSEPDGWCGEIFISVDDAVASAPRFHVTWHSELARYLIHGMLHLRGHDDRQAAARRKMKQEENRLLKTLSRRFDLGRLERLNNAARRK